METSAPKRRKTSPSSALLVVSMTNTTPPGPPPLPAVSLSVRPPAGMKARSTRASYASPTKASLSRHNPDILHRRLSSPTKSLATDNDTRDTWANTRTQGELEESPSPEPDLQLREDAERATSLYQRSDAALLQSPSRQLGGRLPANPKGTPLQSKPRPLPRTGVKDDDDGGGGEVLNPFAGRVLRRSPPAGLPELDAPEPDLPPTPVHPDNVASTPPTGIHSTPSHRPRRSKALAERIRSSPTKQALDKPAADASHNADEHVLPTTETEPSLVPERAYVSHEADERGGKARPRPMPSDIRGVKTQDAEPEKQRELDGLEAEIAELQRDLDVVAQANERVRQLRASRTQVVMPKDMSTIVDVLRRRLEIRPKEVDIPASGSDPWLQAALDPTVFLPFGKSSCALPNLYPEDSSPARQPQKEPLYSHHPIPLTAQEALPFLQAFTPLKLNSIITMLPHASPTATIQDGPETHAGLIQHHSITATSEYTPGLFTARIDFTVDTGTHAITSLAVPSINPPCAAAELSPLASLVTADSGALSRNVVVLTSAMASWVSVDIRRAKAWRTLDRELGTHDALKLTAERVREARSGPKLKRKGPGGVDDSVVAGTRQHPLGDGVADRMDSSVSTEDLLPFLGNQWMDFRIPTRIVGGDAGTTLKNNTVPVLRVHWRIEFEWTGEATSSITASVRLPAKWHHADDRIGLLEIPNLFDKLLHRGGGVVPAVETIVTLLAGDKTGEFTMDRA